MDIYEPYGKPVKTVAEKAARNAELVRRRLAGLSVRTLATLFEISERQVRNIWNNRERPEIEGGADPLGGFLDQLDFIEADIEELTRVIASTDNEHRRLEAIRQRSELRQRRFDLLRDYGLIPWDLKGALEESQVDAIFGVFFSVIESEPNRDAIEANLKDALDQPNDQRVWRRARHLAKESLSLTLLLSVTFTIRIPFALTGTSRRRPAPGGGTTEAA